MESLNVTEIRTTANLQHGHLLPLHDSGRLGWNGRTHVMLTPSLLAFDPSDGRQLGVTRRVHRTPPRR